VEPLRPGPDASVAPALAEPGEAGEETLGSIAAVACLEAWREAGATRLVLPEAAGDWLTERPGFRVHVQARYPLLPDGSHSLEPDGWRSPELALEDFLERFRWRFRRDDPLILDWTRTMRIRPRTTDPPTRDDRPAAPDRKRLIFGPAGSMDVLPNPDAGVDIVVVGDNPSPEALAEARRVARRAVVVWPAAEDSLSVEWLREPKPRPWAVSVVVTDARAGARLAETTVHDGGAIEVVVAEGPSAEALDEAAGRAKGEFLVFVGSETLVLPGWLRPLYRLLRDDETVGATGGRILAADGRLRAPGGELARDPDAPPYGSVRDVDDIPGALLATPAALFRDLGGFAAPAGDGDPAADYCRRVRGAGRRVVFHPQSAVASRRRSAAASQSR
jgi:hypothetical protein